MSRSTIPQSSVPVVDVPRGVRLTAQGRQALTERLERLRGDVLGQLRPHLIGPERDERDVAEFERTLAEIARLEAVLASAEPLERPAGGRSARVQPGSMVEIQAPAGKGSATTRVILVHPEEATIDEERISWDSPLARALLGATAGDRVRVQSPRGPWTCTVVKVMRPPA